MYYVVTEIGANKEQRMRRFAPSSQRKVDVFTHLKTFAWLNPITNCWHVHEAASGTFISLGKTLPEAIATSRKALQKTGDTLFFARLAQFGSALQFEEIPENEVYDQMRRSLQDLLKHTMKRRDN